LLEKQYIFLSNTDLEVDLLNSSCFSSISTYFENETDFEKIVKKMQKAKATFMFDFLLNHSDCLSGIIDTEIAKPILKCKEIAEKIITTIKTDDNAST
jgi:putative ATP-dependent endonuclease of OLD family